MQCTEYSKIWLNVNFCCSKIFPSVSCRSSNYRVTLRSRSTFQNLESIMWLAKPGKGMLFSVEQAFVGRDERRAPLKTPALEARKRGSENCTMKFTLWTVIGLELKYLNAGFYFLSGLNLRPHGTGRILDWFKIRAFRGSVHTDKNFRRLAIQPGSLVPCHVKIAKILNNSVWAMCPLEFLSGRSKTWALVSLIVKLEHENSSITWIFESDYKILNFDQRNESYFVVLSYGTVFDAVKDGFTFWVWMHYPKA